MCNETLLKSYPICKEILETLAEEGKKIAFTSLRKKISTALGCKISHQNFERALAIVNRESWHERNVILTVLVCCDRGLPGMKLWVQAKGLGAISCIPTDPFDQRDTTSHLVEAVFKAYAIKVEPLQRVF
jgi:hypothetical protein